MLFEHLRERLLTAGIAPKHVRRSTRELTDYLDDLAAAQREAGCDDKTALLRARALLGQDEELAAARNSAESAIKPILRGRQWISTSPIASRKLPSIWGSLMAEKRTITKGAAQNRIAASMA